MLAAILFLGTVGAIAAVVIVVDVIRQRRFARQYTELCAQQAQEPEHYGGLR